MMDVDSEWPIGARTKIERQCETSPVHPHIVGDYEYTQELENDETVWHGWLYTRSRANSGEMRHGLHSKQRHQQCKMWQEHQEHQEHQHQHLHQQQHFQRAAQEQQEQQPFIECDAAQVWAPPTAPWQQTIVPLQLRSSQECVDTTDPLGDLPAKRQRTI